MLTNATIEQQAGLVVRHIHWHRVPGIAQGKCCTRADFHVPEAEGTSEGLLYFRVVSIRIAWREAERIHYHWRIFLVRGQGGRRDTPEFRTRGAR